MYSHTCLRKVVVRLGTLSSRSDSNIDRDRCFVYFLFCFVFCFSTRADAYEFYLIHLDLADLDCIMASKEILLYDGGWLVVSFYKGCGMNISTRKI